MRNNTTDHDPDPRPMSPDRVRFAMAKDAAQAVRAGDRDTALDIVRDVRFYEDRLTEVLGTEVDRLLG